MSRKSHHPWEESFRSAGIRPSAHRLAVADYVLSTDRHPSAEEVLAQVTKRFPLLSRATVYNTLNLFVEKGLLRQLVLSEGNVVFDPNLSPHHHFIDEATGHIEDVPWHAVEIEGVDRLSDYQVREYMLVMRGRRLSRSRKTTKC